MPMLNSPELKAPGVPNVAGGNPVTAPLYPNVEQGLTKQRIKRRKATIMRKTSFQVNNLAWPGKLAF